MSSRHKVSAHMDTVTTEHPDGKDPHDHHHPYPRGPRGRRGAPVLGSLHLNTSNGKFFANATVPSANYQASTSFDVDGWTPELPYVEVPFTAAGLIEEDEAVLVDAGYRPVMGLVRGVLATAIAPAPAEDAPGFLSVDFETTGLSQVAPGERTRTSCRCRSPRPS